MWLQAVVDCAPMFDAAYLPDPVPEGFDACLVYGGGTSALHAWPQEDIDRVAHLHQLPAWVPNPAVDSPLVAAEEFLAWLHDHGFGPLIGATGEHQRVVWDMETAGHADSGWLDRACDKLAEAGYWNLPYGSTSTLFGLPARDGYYVADPTGPPHMYLRPEVLITQYQWKVAVNGGEIDLDAIVRSLLPGLRQPSL